MRLHARFTLIAIGLVVLGSIADQVRADRPPRSTTIAVESEVKDSLDEVLMTSTIANQDAELMKARRSRSRRSTIGFQNSDLNRSPEFDQRPGQKPL